MENSMTDLGSRRKLLAPGFTAVEIPDYQMKALEQYPASGLLRMSFWEIEGVRRVSYDTDGFSTLRNLLVLDFFQNRGRFAAGATEFYRLLIDALSCAAEAEDRLLLREPFLYTVDSIFRNVETGEVRLAYLPTNEKKDAQRIILDILEETEKYLTEDPWKFQIEDLRKNIQLINYGYMNLIKYLHRRVRETDLRDWPVREIERGDEPRETEPLPKPEALSITRERTGNLLKQPFFRRKEGEK